MLQLLLDVGPGVDGVVDRAGVVVLGITGVGGRGEAEVPAELDGLRDDTTVEIASQVSLPGSQIQARIWQREAEPILVRPPIKVELEG